MGELLRNIPEKVRGIIYIIVFAVFALTAGIVIVLWALGEVDEGVISTLIGLLLGGGSAGLAAANTSKK